MEESRKRAWIGKIEKLNNKDKKKENVMNSYFENVNLLSDLNILKVTDVIGYAPFFPSLGRFSFTGKRMSFPTEAVGC